jgi:predicted thioesterase
MWYLLIIYIGAISYGFIALKLVSDPDRFLNSSVLILGVYTFCILFLYMKNTIALLRPDHVVEMLVNEINAENIHQKEWKDDIMQPVFDVVHASIMRFDVTTTRTGLNALSERVLELFLAFDEKNREKKSHDVTEHLKSHDVAEHFCKHIQRSALVALRNEDEGILREIIIVLQNFGTHAADNGLEGATRRVVETLRDVGIHAADKGLEDATGWVVETLRDVGIHAADKELEDATGWVAYALEAVGTHAADKGLEGATTRVAYALGVVGIHAADKGLEGATRGVVETLRDVGIHAADKGLEGATTRVAYALGGVGSRAADKGLEGATGWVAYALEAVGTHAADKGLEDATGRVVHALCRLGLKGSGQNVAAESLAQLMFRYTSTITELIKKFESELKSEQKDQFTTFMNKVNEELHKLESPEQPR